MLLQLLSPIAAADSSKINSRRRNLDPLLGPAASQRVNRPKPQVAGLRGSEDLCGCKSKLCAAVLEKVAVIDAGLLPMVTEEETNVHIGLSELQSLAGVEASAQVRFTCPVKLPTGVMRIVEEPLPPEVAMVTGVACS